MFDNDPYSKSTLSATLSVSCTKCNSKIVPHYVCSCDYKEDVKDKALSLALQKLKELNQNIIVDKIERTLE